MYQASAIVHAEDRNVKLEKNFECKSEVVERQADQAVSKPAQSIIVRSPIVITVKQNELKNQIDDESQLGHFGWPADVNDLYSNIPYIQRGGEKYFATKMIEMKYPIDKYLHCLNPTTYSYYYKVRQYATEAEARLLNEINWVHCDGKFGQLLFTTESLLVKCSDAYALYEFLDTCYRKLSITQIISNKIGFILFSDYVYIPFVGVNSELYMPLHCFSNTNNLQIDFISGWDLAYMQFCCLYQNTWIHEQYTDIMPVVSLTTLKANLPSNTQFEICWPNRNDHGLIMPSPKKNVGLAVICVCF